MTRSLLGIFAVLLAVQPVWPQGSFVNFETPHVHPLALTPDGNTLLAVNTPDSRLEVFDLSSGLPVPVGAIPVGLDPVSVRARSNTEAWVVNQISDSVSIVDLTTLRTVASLATHDEPADVVFAGDPERAFVSCSQTNEVMVFDPSDLGAAPTVISIEGEDPRAMAVSNDGGEVYVGVFESGNRTTALGGGIDDSEIVFPPNVVSDPLGPYGGENPPPNTEAGFEPPLNPVNPTPLRVALIVKQGDDGIWRDDRGTDWTEFVSGTNAELSGRPVGWQLIDNDVAVIDTDTLTVTYAEGLMNAIMAIAVNPANDQVTVVGTEATNEIRYEPIINGTFVRVNAAFVDPTGPTRLGIVDLNDHLSYATATVDQSERDKSIGDPRAIAWSSDGTRGWVAGMGSNNLIVIDENGARVGVAPTVEVGEGPTGLVLDEARQQLYVLNKFAASISTVSTATETEIDQLAFYDPSPEAIKVGRKHLYGTHETSGLGQTACASCHIDARMDRLGWDLGDPAGEMKSTNGQNRGDFNILLNFGFEDWHPMKGPMTTQTLQDIIGKEPHHWRGDRTGIEEFNPAFMGLLGDDVELTDTEMQEFEDFLATIHFPPNPFRNLDNSLPSDLPLPNHYTTGRFEPAGQPLPNGNAQRALDIYRFPRLIDNGAFSCSTCHTMPTGLGTNRELVGLQLDDIPVGPDGEKHHALVSQDGQTNVTIKIPHLRNMYDKVGFEATQVTSLAGFGFLHDGSIDSLSRFITEELFEPAGTQEVADLVALMLAFSGSDLPGGTDGLLETFQPHGPSSQDAHAAVGRQTTLVDPDNPDPGQLEFIDAAIGFADEDEIDLIVKGLVAGLGRGYVYAGADSFQSDVATEILTKSELYDLADVGSELTFTVVPNGSGGRLGIDRDLDGAPDGDERAACSDGTDPASLPGGRMDVSSGPIVAGGPHVFSVTCAIPGRTLGFAVSTDGLGITQIPQGELGIENAKPIGTDVVAVDGTASVTVDIPGVASGTEVWWQVIDLDDGDVSDIETTIVQ